MRMPACKSFQSQAWTNFEKNRLRILQQLFHAVGETDSLPNVPGPILRIGSFFIGDPRSAHIRNEWYLRRVELDTVNEFEEWSERRFHHAGMKRMRSAESLAGCAFCGQLLFELFYCFISA